MLGWGILTNGNEWRLYCRDAKPSHYFGINFEVAIQSKENFKYFLALFSPAAFTRDAQGKCRLDQIRENALATQAELEADLRERIFTIVEILANGFAERPENKIGDTDEDRRKLIENCLIFLYRLLFVLYAEGRSLLPVEPKSRKYYKQLSLARLRAPLKNFSEYDSQTQTRFYRDIHALCLLINGTDKKANDEFGVPRYNGGLFDPDRYPLLKEWAVSDAVLADVLRQLMFTPEKAGQKFVPFESVDYADLSVQQLGSIYEGLLEHHFVRENGKLALKTDKAERKATGTYYTPDYIVKYIVENTLGPLLREIEQRDNVKAGRPDNSFANEVLKLNVCDPAMGSGHFLVEATVYLADHVVYHPTTKFQVEFAKGESQEETEISYWRRRVVEACIYGVDLNSLAVELAKLSLWLTTIASDQPLNFLDHHLRCGNSLIGARLDQLGRLPQKKGKRDERQIHFTFGPDFKRAVAEAIGQIHEIEGEASRDMATVKSKEKRWEVEILPRLAPYKKVADLWTNIFFDGPLSEEEYLAAAKEILIVAQEGADRLQEAAARYRIKELDRPYFHWELEFPEVFFNDDGSLRDNAGFDVVIGNPPWGMLQPHNTEPPLLGYLRSSFECSEFKVDMFQLFLEQSLRLIGRERSLGMIVPNTLLTNTYCRRIREIFQRQTAVRFIAATAEMVFPDAEVHPAIVVAQKTLPYRNEVRVLVHETAEPFQQVLTRRPYVQLAQEDMAAFDGSSWSIRLDSRFARVVRTLIAHSKRLREVAFVKRGLISGNREKYFAAEKKGPKWYPIVTGTDVQRYGIVPPAEYVLFEKPGRTAGGCWDEDVHLRKGKILLKQVGRWPQAAVDEGPFCITGNVFAVILKESTLSPYFVTSILNSRLTQVVWSVVLSDFKAVFPELKGEWIEQWPIRGIALTTPPAERKRHVAKGRDHYGHGLSAGSADDILDFVAKQLAANRTDVIHDLLAFLAERMMELNKEKQTAAKRFLTDLKDFHGVDARALTPKTKLDEFWKLETDAVFAHLRANTKTLAAAGVRLKESDEEKIRDRFQKSKEQLVPLETQIRFIDELIDQIVYRLYGLTPEEIQLVEEAIT